MNDALNSDKKNEDPGQPATGAGPPAPRSRGAERPSGRQPDPDFDHALRLQMMVITGE